MRIVLLGASGQVGWELQRSLAPLGEVFALHRLSAPHSIDLSDPDSLARTVDLLAPDVIVNAAAYTAVDKAETEVELCRSINTQAVAALAKVAASRSAWLVHYSTDYVFDGLGTRPFVENDATAPVNMYGLTKREGELAIARSACKHLIFRTSWVYAARGANFAKTMLRLAQERETLKVIDDQVGAPTGADLIADVTAHALRMAWGNDALSGIYHLVASGEVSWHGYASYAIEQARRMQPDRAWRVNEITAVPTSEFPTPARRPANSRLDTSKLQKAFALQMPTWQSGIDRLLAEIL